MEALIAALQPRPAAAADALEPRGMAAATTEVQAPSPPPAAAALPTTVLGWMSFSAGAVAGLTQGLNALRC